MQKNIPYRTLPQAETSAAVAAPFDLLCLSPAPAADGAAVAFFDRLAPPVLDASLLPEICLLLTLEAVLTGPAPALTLHLGPMAYTLSLAGMARLSAGYGWTAVGGTALLPAFGGALEAGGTAWIVSEPAYVSGALPTAGPVVLGVAAAWQDIDLRLVRLEGRFAASRRRV